MAVVRRGHPGAQPDPLGHQGRRGERRARWRTRARRPATARPGGRRSRRARTPSARPPASARPPRPSAAAAGRRPRCSDQHLQPCAHRRARARSVERMATRPAAGPRSLADELRSWDDARLVALLRARPDVMTPLPNDLTTVAARCTTRASVHRVLDSLDTFELQVLDALAVLPDPASRTEVARLLGVRPTTPGPDAGPAARPRPGLGSGHRAAAGADRARHGRAVPRRPRPALADRPGRPRWTRCSPRRLTGRARCWTGWSGSRPSARCGARTGRPAGRPPDRRWSGCWRTACSPCWTRTTSCCPARSVCTCAAGGCTATSSRSRPRSQATERAPRLVDAAAGGAASDLLRLVAELGELWGVTPPPVLRSGGLGVRDLRRTATALDVAEPTAAVVIELAYAAGLVADDGQVGASWAPTPAYDAWTSEPPAGRWRRIAAAWLSTSRVPELVGERDDRGNVRAALSAEVDRAPAAAVRQSVLAVLAELPAGNRAGRRHPAGPAALAAAAADRRAGRAARPLGGAGGRAAGRHGPRRAQRGRARAAGRRRRRRSRARVAALLPAPVDHVLLQADLTAVAPGPLEVDLGRLMHLAADVESRGGATVYRFTPDSVRRALDSGLGRRAAARRAGRGQPDARAPAAGVPGARRRPPARSDPGRRGPVLRAQRRRERAARADGRPASGAPVPAGAGAQRAGGSGRAGHGAAGAAVHGTGPGRRVVDRRGRGASSGRPPHPAAPAPGADPRRGHPGRGPAAAGRGPGAAVGGAARRPRRSVRRWPRPSRPTPGRAARGDRETGSGCGSATPTARVGWSAASSSRSASRVAGSPRSTTPARRSGPSRCTG